MADKHYTRERAAWVQARAGRRLEARRRGEVLAARARRLARDQVGAGDAPVTDVVTSHRVIRKIRDQEEFSIGRVLWVGLVELGRVTLIGPATALSWGIYAIGYRQVPSWGPLRWRPLAVAAGVVTAATVLAAWGMGLGGVDVPWWAWWALAQPALGVARAAWLAYAWGWEAATGHSQPQQRQQQLASTPAPALTVPVRVPAAQPRVVRRVVRRKPAAQPQPGAPVVLRRRPSSTAPAETAERPADQATPRLVVKVTAPEAAGAEIDSEGEGRS